jgi:hypothetical protein
MRRAPFGCKPLRRQLLKQRLRPLQVARVKPFGEPTINRCQQLAPFAVATTGHQQQTTLEADMRSVLVGGIYVVKKDDETEYWAAATIKERAIAAVEQELGPGWTVTLTDRRLTGQRLSKLRMPPTACKSCSGTTKVVCIPSPPRAPKGLASARQVLWLSHHGVGIRRTSRGEALIFCFRDIGLELIRLWIVAKPYRPQRTAHWAV